MDNSIINEVISLQAFFKAGYDRATILRKKLEGETSPAPTGGLSTDQKVKLRTDFTKTILKKKTA